MKILILLFLLGVVSTSPRQDGAGAACKDSPCGVNSVCFDIGDQGLCFCKDGYDGDPYNACLKPGATCKDLKCGKHALCIDRFFRGPECSCELPYTEGNPYKSCTQPEILCVCGDKAHCESYDGSQVCVCDPGFEGDPYQRCWVPPCVPRCGDNAFCSAFVGTPELCLCKPGFTGDPHQGCHAIDG
ncbi:hypothetical protein QR680_010375 [Steinernema hermaphroditum]|uniref:EGF-like domain-containing protein n=1 Tax=Steinernema hermaphroditum TaxID=289476 RepID=A0AA39MAK2_9BILA|nr:hypothetical protein QR680_010375 [Steinernema hermaphroditum]